jgi:2'-5' RNA ligase
MISLMKLVEGRYDYGCVMANIDEDDSRKIIDFNYKTINEDILYTEESDSSFGREQHPHVTIKYGLVKSYTEEQIKKLLHQVTPFNIQVRGISIFENDKFDVVKFDVESPELRKINEIFSNLPNHDEYPTYNPHMTIAYVKKGMGNRFVKSPGKFAKIPVRSIVYSDRGNRSYINL